MNIVGRRVGTDVKRFRDFAAHLHQQPLDERRFSSADVTCNHNGRSCVTGLGRGHERGTESGVALRCIVEQLQPVRDAGDVGPDECVGERAAQPVDIHDMTGTARFDKRLTIAGIGIARCNFGIEPVLAQKNSLDVAATGTVSGAVAQQRLLGAPEDVYAGRHGNLRCLLAKFLGDGRDLLAEACQHHRLAKQRPNSGRGFLPCHESRVDGEVLLDPVKGRADRGAASIGSIGSRLGTLTFG